MKPQPAHPRPPIDPLTSLRFFAALLVVFYHLYAGLLPSKPLPDLANSAIAIGFIGVSFFFVLSGFILAYNYLGPPPLVASPERAADDLAAKETRRAFFVARFARIYPLYLLALLVHAPFVAAHRLHQDASATLALGKLLASFAVNAALLQAFLRKLWGGWNSPGWSLSAEAFFYAVFPFVAPRLYRSRRGDLTLLAGLYAAALAVPLAVMLLERQGLFHLADVEALETFPLLRLPEFLFGVVLARVHLRARAGGDASPVFRNPALLYGAGALLLTLAVLAHGAISSLLLHNGLLAPAFGLVILGLSRGDGPLHRLLSLRPLCVLGEASYGVYILHIPLYAWCCILAQPQTTFASSPQPFGGDQPLVFAAYLTALIALSWASLRFVEEPARRWIRRAASR